MNGSEKQINWAKEIVAGEIAAMEKHLNCSRQRVALDGEKFPALRQMLRAQEIACAHAIAAISQIDSAKTIIDNRNVRYYVLPTILKNLVGEELEIVRGFVQTQTAATRGSLMSLLVG